MTSPLDFRLRLLSNSTATAQRARVMTHMGVGRMCDQIDAWHALRAGAPTDVVATVVFERMKERDPCWRFAFAVARGGLGRTVDETQIEGLSGVQSARSRKRRAYIQKIWRNVMMCRQRHAKGEQDDE